MKHRAYVYLICTYFLWSTMFVAQKYLLDLEMSPFLIASVRFIIAAVTLLPFTRHLPKPKIEKGDAKYFFFAGALGYFGSPMLDLLALPFVGAALGSLIASLSPVIISILAIFVLKEKMTRMKLVCLLLGLIGVCISVGGVDSGKWIGALLLIGSHICWGLSSCFIRKLSSRYHPMIITQYALFFALIFNVPGFGISVAMGGVTQIDLKSIFLLLYLGFCCATVALMLWNKSLSMLEASICSLFAPLQPVFAAILGVVLLSEVVGLPFFIAAVLIIGNILLVALVGSGKIKDAPLFTRKKDAVSDRSAA